ncbi:FUSC family protein [Apibacter muscae]|uniref:FUSC family protein n=1 Tax=Apibacter muscae TaxID=2509004 RepID=UPI0011ADB412|nr:FUSC family protein [Apibacter muscae]TWP23873.1 FUSC family protein [Apibacter muscae]
MKIKNISTDNFVFFTSTGAITIISFLFLGLSSIALGIISVMFTYIIYSAKPKSGKYIYTFFWLSMILFGCYLGILFKLSIEFYIFLFLLSNYYYIAYNHDPISDRAIPYFIIYSSLGTTLKDLSYHAAIAYLLGSIITLTMIAIVNRRKLEFINFQSSEFTQTLFTHPFQNFVNSLIFSSFLFLTLYLPEQLKLERSYWAVMTFVVLLKPKDQGILTNTIKRFLGNLAGSIVVLIIMNIDSKYRIFHFLVILLCVFFLPTFLNFKYFLKTFGLTVFILILLESSEFWKDPNYSLPFARIYETFLGGLLALLGSFIMKRIHQTILKET